MDQTTLTDTTQIKPILDDPAQEAEKNDQDFQRQQASDQAAEDQRVADAEAGRAVAAAKNGAAGDAPAGKKQGGDPAASILGEGTNPPVGSTVAEAQAAAAEQSPRNGLDADEQTAGRVDESQATKDREEAAGYVGVRTDPTPHSHYTLDGVIAGKPTPETNAAAAFLVGNGGRYADLSEDERDDHHNAEGVDEIARRAHELRFV